MNVDLNKASWAQMCRTKTLCCLKPATFAAVCEHSAGLCPGDCFIGMCLAFQNEVPVVGLPCFCKEQL